MFLRECSIWHTVPSQPIVMGSASGHRSQVFRPPLMRSTSHSPSRQMTLSRSSSQSPSRVLTNKHQLKKPLCNSVLNINQSNPTKRPNYLQSNKPRNVNRLKSKSKMQEIAQDILPNFNLSFLSDSRQTADTSQVTILTSDGRKYPKTFPMVIYFLSLLE